MSRSTWKGTYIDKKITRATKVLPSFVNKTFNVYNGEIFIEVAVKSNMIGHKFGEFVFTRKKNIFKKKKKKK